MCAVHNARKGRGQPMVKGMGSGRRRRHESEQLALSDVPDLGDDMSFMPRTRSGHALDVALSALQKAIRRARTNEAVYFTREIVDSGFVRYFWRRMMIIASEEVSSDPVLCGAIGQLARNAELASKSFTGRVECIIEVQAVISLCRARKSREACDASGVAYHSVQNGFRITPSDVAVDMHTREGRSRGRNIKDFRDGGRYVAGATERNDFEERLWKVRQPFLGLPGEDGAAADIEWPDVEWLPR